MLLRKGITWRLLPLRAPSGNYLYFSTYRLRTTSTPFSYPAVILQLPQVHHHHPLHHSSTSRRCFHSQQQQLNRTAQTDFESQEHREILQRRRKMGRNWTHLIRFIAKEDGQAHLGEIDPQAFPDVGLAALKGETITAKLIKGSVYDGVVTSKTLTVSQLLSPISRDETSLIRCLGLNYRDHAKEANMPIPDDPVLFIKPRWALMGPHPEKIIVPKIAQDGTSDYEAELTIIIAKTGKDISKEEAFEYVLGYTCGNDVSARTQQFKNSQWSYSKGMDSSAPIGPVLVSPEALKDPHSLSIKAIHNGSVVQDSNTKEMIFDIPAMIAFLSQGTTLEQGTVIMTGTPPGIGCMRTPKVVLNDGDDMRVEIEKIGTLINTVYYE